MKKICGLMLVFAMSSAHSIENACNYKILCKEMDEAVILVNKDKNSKKNFLEVLKIASKLTKVDCLLPGYEKKKFPVLRLCHDQGFRSENGKAVEWYKGPYSEEQILEWFTAIRDSKFEEKNKFIRSKEFMSTLDGIYAEFFFDKE
ncbi:MAG: hypothetical protein K2P81_15080 [Bacteriovoracaceae bacterium]|nr:hypothetical protein [Bacteriovoracaceae bacterium]